MDTEKKYKALLLAEQAEAIKALDPYRSVEDNLEWLWGSVKQLGEMTSEIQCALCQLSLHFGRSALEQANMEHILSEPNKNSAERIQAIIDCLSE